MKKHKFLKRLLSALTLLVFSVNGFPARGETEEVLTVQAENGTLLGKARVAQQMFDKYVTGLENDGDGVKVLLSVPESGFYDLSVRVRSGSYKENYVDVDGARAGVISGTFPLWGNAVLERLWLEQGEHEIAITKFWGWTDIDSFTLTPAQALPEHICDVSAKLTDANATEQARRLMSYLADVYGKKIITGQYSDGGMNGVENLAVYDTVNEYPAILGLDLIEYSPSRALHGSKGRSIEQAIKYWNAGGIVTFCWHWNAPERYLKGIWYSGFYTEHTSIDLEKIMNGEDPEGYALLLSDMDAIAEQLARLQDAGVPVLWRPLHEASGGWFWWGAKGAEAYIQLYRLMYERFTEFHELHNLIWVWNGQSADWYPGDDVVDIIGWDIYAGERNYGSQCAVFLEAASVTDKRMMIILSENGTVPDIDLLFRDGAVWGSFATWSGDFVVKRNQKTLSETYTEAEILKKMYADERSVSRSELPDLKTYPIRQGS